MVQAAHRVLDGLDRSLLLVLCDHDFHSGTALASRLGVTRATVCNHVRRLTALGLDIAALPGRGYRLGSPVELLSEADIRAGVSPVAAALLAGMALHDDIDSTNSYLMRAARLGAPSGMVCLAERQSAGRGRIGRDWVSPFGANIYLSLLWRFDEPGSVAGLSLAVGVAVLRALARAGFSHASLKWPNDLLCDGAKLGGILLDVAGEMHGQCTVLVGLGLNRHVPDSAAAGIDQAWTDLGRVVQGPPPARNALIALLLNEMLPLLHEYSEQGLLPYLPEWRRAHAYQGREASLHMGDTVIHGRIADVTDDGLLLLELEDGSQRPFASGDVRLRVSRS